MKKLILIAIALLIISCSKDEVINNNISFNIDVNHYNWSPDTLIVDSFLIDLDNDYDNDLKFLIKKDYQGTSPSGGSYYNYFAQCSSINSNLKVSLGNEVVNSQSNWNCLKFNHSISNNLTWKKSFNLKGTVVGAGEIGFWDINDNDGYIGLKFETNGIINFGWIKAEVNNNYFIDKRYEIKCLEYAISETQNALIKAGQTE